MVLAPFLYKGDNTRLVQHEDTVYKLKIVFSDDAPETQDPEISDSFHSEVEEVLRAVLYMIENNENFIRIQTKHFLVVPSMSRWKVGQKLEFLRNGKELKAYKNVIILTLSHSPEPSEEISDCLETTKSREAQRGELGGESLRKDEGEERSDMNMRSNTQVDANLRREVRHTDVQLHTDVSRQGRSTSSNPQSNLHPISVSRRDVTPATNRNDTLQTDTTLRREETHSRQMQTDETLGREETHSRQMQTNITLRREETHSRQMQTNITLRREETHSQQMQTEAGLRTQETHPQQTRKSSLISSKPSPSRTDTEQTGDESINNNRHTLQTSTVTESNNAPEKTSVYMNPESTVSANVSNNSKSATSKSTAPVNVSNTSSSVKQVSTAQVDVSNNSGSAQSKSTTSDNVSNHPASLNPARSEQVPTDQNNPKITPPRLPATRQRLRNTTTRTDRSGWLNSRKAGSNRNPSEPGVSSPKRAINQTMPGRLCSPQAALVAPSRAGKTSPSPNGRPSMSYRRFLSALVEENSSGSSNSLRKSATQGSRSSKSPRKSLSSPNRRPAPDTRSRSLRSELVNTASSRVVQSLQKSPRSPNHQSTLEARLRSTSPVLKEKQTKKDERLTAQNVRDKANSDSKEQNSTEISRLRTRGQIYRDSRGRNSHDVSKERSITRTRSETVQQSGASQTPTEDSVSGRTRQDLTKSVNRKRNEAHSSSASPGDRRKVEEQVNKISRYFKPKDTESMSSSVSAKRSKQPLSFYTKEAAISNKNNNNERNTESGQRSSLQRANTSPQSNKRSRTIRGNSSDIQNNEKRSDPTRENDIPASYHKNRSETTRKKNSDVYASNQSLERTGSVRQTLNTNYNLRQRKRRNIPYDSKSQSPQRKSNRTATRTDSQHKEETRKLRENVSRSATMEEGRLYNLRNNSSDNNRKPETSSSAASSIGTFEQKDRHVVETGDIQEELKLQTLASGEGEGGGRSLVPGSKRKSNLMQTITDTFISPFKRMLSSHTDHV